MLKDKLGKQKHLVITFDTPNDAFAMEAACRAANLPGRLMPAPVALTGGCGIGWTCPPEARDELTAFIAEHKLKIKLMTELEF